MYKLESSYLLGITKQLTSCFGFTYVKIINRFAFFGWIQTFKTGQQYIDFSPYEVFSVQTLQVHQLLFEKHLIMFFCKIFLLIINIFNTIV